MLRARPSAFSFAQPLEPAHVGMAAGLDQPDHRVIVGRLEPGQVERRARRLGQHAPRRGMREAGLADALGPGEQPGVVQPAAMPRRLRIARRRWSWPTITAAGPAMASSRRCVTSPGLPEASISRTRSGSSAAIMRKASVDLVVVIGAAAADAVAAARRRGRGARSLPFVEHQHQGAVGKVVADREGVDRAHRLDAEPARAALVGERAVDESGRDSTQRPASSAGPDGPGDMVGAGGGEQQGFGARVPAVFVAAEQQLADRFGARRFRPARG